MLATFRRSSRRGARLRVLPLALLVGLALPASAQVSNAVVTVLSPMRRAVFCRV